MTANVLENDIWRCIYHGMQGHIGKPLCQREIYSSSLKVFLEEIEVKNDQYFDFSER